MEHNAVFRFRSVHAETIYRAVCPEMDAEVHSRSRAACSLEGSHILVLEVRARDIAALRASLNMWLRLISVAEEMQVLAEERGEERI